MSGPPARDQGSAVDQERCPIRRDASSRAPPLPLITAHAEQTTVTIMIMICGSHNDTIVTASRRSQTVVDLTCQHKNQTLLVEGLSMIRPVGTRRVTGGSR
jgi:hypothetical protein